MEINEIFEGVLVTTQVEINQEDIALAFSKFIHEFVAPDKEGKPKKIYEEQLYELAFGEKEKFSLIVDFNHLSKFDIENDTHLAEALLVDPENTLKTFTRVLRNLLISTGNFTEEEARKYFVRIKNVGEVLSIRSLRAEHIGKIVRFRGIVLKVTKPKQLLLRALWRCNVCGTEFVMEYEDGVFRKPKRCASFPACTNTRDFILLERGREYLDYQEITVQELPEELPPGRLPQNVPVVLTGDLVGTIRPGDRVIVTAILKAQPTKALREGSQSLFNIVAYAIYIEGESPEMYKDIELTEEEKRMILSLRDDPDLERKIIESIAPSVYGHDIIKKALAAALFGGVEKHLPDGTRIRGDIHVLLVGDPGTAKSHLLKCVASVAPRAIYTTGKGVSAAGLTAAVVRTKDEWTLEAGVLVLADRGIAVIDEFDKMRKEDRQALHEAMEQQSVSISKAGIVATLNARTTIIAAANPKFGRYIDRKEFSENVDLPPTILSRFDLIFVLKDKPNEEIDSLFAEQILKVHSGERQIKPPFSPEFLKKYIMFAREYIKPKLTKKAAEKIKEFYVKMRSLAKATEEESFSQPIPITPRYLHALIRLSEAHARMLLKEEVTEEDVDFAIELMLHSLKQAGMDPSTKQIDIGIIEGMSAKKRSKYLRVLEIIEELSKTYGEAGVPITEVYKRAEQEGISRIFVDRIIQREINNGTLYEPTPGRLKFALRS